MTAPDALAYQDLSKHNQTPDALTDDPLQAINDHGNYGRAVELLAARINAGGAAATDHELLGYALRAIGRPAQAAERYDFARALEPGHPRAADWERHAKDCARTARNGAHVLRPHGVVRPDGAPAGSGAHDWVLDHSGWIKPNGHIHAKTLRDRVTNRLYARVFDLLPPIGRLVDRFKPELPNSTGRWTGLPTFGKGVLRLADLASRRDWMMDNARLPPGVTTQDENAGAKYSEYGFAPDGRGNNPRYRDVGGVGTAVPFHGLPETYQQRDRTADPELPPAAALAKDFGYRNGGEIKEALTASAHAWGHLQMLVHDVMQTALDDRLKHASPVGADSEEAQLGVRNVHYRSDAVNVMGGPADRRMNGVTGAWDMSTIYGSSVEQVARVRTNPNTGKPCPDGKIYLDGMDGEGEQFLPTEIGPDGQEMIVTGFARNMTAPLEAEHTLYARHHNWVCDVLRERHPDWRDNQIFEIARRVVALTYVKIHTAPWTDALFAHPSVAQGLHANVFGRREWNKPFDRQKIYDPRGGDHPIADGLVSNQNLKFAIPEAKGSNFADAYRFGHTIIPDVHYFPPIGEKTVKGETESVNTKDLRELDGHRFLKERGLGFVFHGLMNTRLGAPVAGNYADFFRRMDTEEGVVDLFEAEIVKDRQRGAPAYNDYLRSHNLPPLRSFADLFTDPDAPPSRERIGKLEAHYKRGVEDLDTPLGLLLNEFRPDGFAITNPGFQTFVFEATARIAKQAHLTRLWSPEHVGWTAINLVEAMNKEKLLYLHCPELRDYLQTRPNRNTYEYMGTSHKTHPQEHPLAEILTYDEEDLADTGLGDPWRDEHFNEKALDSHYLIRVRHRPTDRTFVVDLSEGTVRYDRNGDGRVHRSEVMTGPVDGVTAADLIAAARDIRASNVIPWPGRACSYDPDFVSAWRLTPDEIKTLKLFEGDEKAQGIAERLTDLEIHLLIFNLGGNIDLSRFSENLLGWQALEESEVRAYAMTLISAVRFGAKSVTLAFPTTIKALTKRRPSRSTGIFDRDGMIDPAKFAEYRNDVEALGKTNGGHVPKSAFMDLLARKGALGLTTRGQWSSFFRLMKRLEGRETVTPDTFVRFYDGTLLFDAFERFAPRHAMQKLEARSYDRIAEPGWTSAQAA